MLLSLTCSIYLSCSCPVQVNLSSNSIPGSGEAMGEALKTSTSIKKLELVGCGLSPEDGQGLAGGIAASGSLTEVCLCCLA